MNIYQASDSSMNTDKGKRMLAFILQAYPFLESVEFSIEPFDFHAYPVPADVSESETAEREINGGLNKFVYVPGTASGSQKAYGYEFEVDQAYLNDLNSGVSTPEALRRRLENEQLRLAKKVASRVVNHMFSGSGAGTQILGLRNFVKDVAAAAGQTAYYGLTQEQIHSSLIPGNLTLDLTFEKDLYLFKEMIFRAMTEMEGTPAILCNEYMAIRMTSIAEKLKLAGTITTPFGTVLKTFGDSPIVKVPVSALPFDESDGENADCSSLFIVNYDEVDGVRVATNAGFKFTDFASIETKPTGKSRLEFYGNHKIEDTRKIKRISRIRLGD
jgi:hypothetical protein